MVGSRELQQKVSQPSAIECTIKQLGARHYRIIKFRPYWVHTVQYECGVARIARSRLDHLGGGHYVQCTNVAIDEDLELRMAESVPNSRSGEFIWHPFHFFMATDFHAVAQ